MEKKLRAVKIFRDAQTRIDFLFLAEFFHFCGLYVGEGVFSESDYFAETDCSCFDVFIFAPDIGKLISESNTDAARYTELENKVGGLIQFCDIKNSVLHGRSQEIHQCEPAEQLRILTECLKQINVRISMEADDIDWSPLVRIYVENNLMIHSSSLQYYSQRKSVAIEEALEGMMKAYCDIEELFEAGGAKENWKIDEYVKYARIWCQTKVNTCCEYEGKALFFSPQKLAEASQKLCEEHPDFSNAKVLQGLCYEHSKDKANEAISAFNQALDMDKGRCYTTAVLYWLGKRYEAYESRQDGAEYFYRQAYETKKKFRNIYKLAMYEKDRKEYLKAEKYYREIVDILEQRRLTKADDAQKCSGKNMLDPLELEYEFKVCRQMCVMFFQDCPDIALKYSKAIQYGKQAVKIYEEDIDNSLMYERLYGEERMPKYRNISKKRMELRNIYRILYLSYSDLQEDELAKKYRRKMREWED